MGLTPSKYIYGRYIYMTMESMPMVNLDVYHDSTLWSFRDARRVAPMHEAHPPPVIA
jgi:hypothetical protein